jgi:hypothetical protein
MNEYYILSLNHSRKRDRLLTWWRPNDSDYCYRLEWAGKYTKEQVEKRATYYNDRVHTVAIPREIVDALAIQVRDARSPYLDETNPGDHVVEYRHILKFRPRKTKAERHE